LYQIFNLVELFSSLDRVYVKNSLTVLNLYRCCINLVSQFNWPCCVF